MHQAAPAAMALCDLGVPGLIARGGRTGARREVWVCKRLGQAGLAGQVQACAAGARQQHVGEGRAGRQRAPQRAELWKMTLSKELLKLKQR